jgi:uncharacterized protein YecE (DUF72 family)
MDDYQSIYIGTSGWHYDHWRGPFYSHNLSKDEFLIYYSSNFQTVEINNTFYQLPERKTLIGWRDTVPAGFVFSVKASRYITHMKKLKDPEESLTNLLGRIKVLEDKLGPVLFQLPPNWNFNFERLDSFLGSLPPDYRYAFEFRDQSWLNPQAYEALAKHGAAFCIYDFDRRLSPREVTADFVYVRLHGPDGPYQGQYETEALSGWVGAFSTWSSEGKDIYCYFDNDQHGYAVRNAFELQEMVKGKHHDIRQEASI